MFVVIIKKNYYVKEEQVLVGDLVNDFVKKLSNLKEIFIVNFFKRKVKVFDDSNLVLNRYENY